MSHGSAQDAPSSTGRATGGRRESRTLVIGCGFIGSNVVVQSAADGRPPTVLTRSRPAEEIVAAIGESNLHLGDAADTDTVEAVLGGIDQVAFCAGGLLPVAAESDPELDRRLTLGPVRAVLAALRERPDVTLTYLSSGGTVYGEPQRLPVAEDDPTVPRSAYGTLHLACEGEIERARLEHGLRSRILRCSTVYGEHQRPDRGQGAIVTFLHRIERGEPIDLYGGGSTIRDYIFAGDVARILIALADRHQAPSIVNVGSGKGTSLLEVLRLAESQVGRIAQIVQHPEREFDIHQIVLDITRLRESADLNLTPLGAGIERTHRWLAKTAREAA
jgi:UDP-glucose 4-epimerase